MNKKRLSLTFLTLLLVVVFAFSVVGCCKNGADGKDGANGLDGKNGINGVDGRDGKDGADGADGVDGHSPVIVVVDGYWTVDGISTEVKAVGEDGVTPTVEIVDGYWVINGVATEVKALAVDGTTPTVSINAAGYWVINGEVSEVKARGTDGHTPTISINGDGYWVIDGETSEVLARGTNGVTPTISISNTGYWVINGNVTEVLAVGKNGESPVLTIEDGYWVINGVKSDTYAGGSDGKNIYELYKEVYGYEGTVAEWLTDVLNGTLDVATLRTVTYDYAGLTGDLKASDFVQDGRTLTLPVPERTGYIFLGWFTGVGETAGKWTDVLPVSEDMTLVARWQKLVYTVRYLDKDGALLSEQSIDYGEDAEAPVPPYIANYTFDHWTLSGADVIADLEISPVYYPDRYTVTYDTDGGSAVAPVSYLYNETPVRPTAPTKSGMYFDRWVNASSEETYAFDAPLTADTTLRAVWVDCIMIHDAEELSAIRDLPNANYCLANDIDLEGAEWTPITTFGGTLDGDGHTISDFEMTVASQNLAFIKTNNGTIRNIVFEDIMVNQSYVGNTNTAVIAATNNGTIISVNIIDLSLNYTLEAINTEHFKSIRYGVVCAENRGEINSIQVNYTQEINVNIIAGGKQSIIYIGAVADNYGIVEQISAISEINSQYYLSGLQNNTYNDVWTYQGSIVGYNRDIAYVRDCHGSVDMNIDHRHSTSLDTQSHSRSIGGVVGYNQGILAKLSAIGSIGIIQSGRHLAYWDFNVGGICGVVGSGTISSAVSCVDISITQSTKHGSIGGIVGLIQSTTACRNVAFYGSIQGNNTTSIGGIVGANAGSLTAAATKSSLSGSNTSIGYIVGRNISSGSAMKYLIFDESYSGNGVGIVEGGLINDYYCINSSNRNAILNEDYLFGENILSMNVWGVCEGLSIYLKDFACETHDYGDTPACRDHYCLKCDYAAPAVDGHVYNDYVYNGDATCTEDGTETAHCAYGCGATDTRAKAGSATGHSFTVYTDHNDATCTSAATEIAHCDHGCGATDIREKDGSAALGHYYIQGRCLRCGDYAPAVLAALDSGVKYYHVDLDRDGTFSLGDYVYYGYYPQSAAAGGVEIGAIADGDGYYLGSDGYRYALYEDGYYKVEPIRWIVKGDNAGKVTLYSEKVLFSSVYQSELNELDGVYYNTTVGTPEYTYANDYAESTLAKALSTFKAVAFDADSEALLYGAVATPTKAELKDASFGFENTDGSSNKRTFAVTAYAAADGTVVGCWSSSAEESSPYNAAYAVTVSTGAITAVNVASARGVLPVVVLDLGE